MKTSKKFTTSVVAGVAITVLSAAAQASTTSNNVSELEFLPETPTPISQLQGLSFGDEDSLNDVSFIEDEIIIDYEGQLVRTGKPPPTSRHAGEGFLEKLKRLFGKDSDKDLAQNQSNIDDDFA